jgi:hypothetical protein
MRREDFKYPYRVITRQEEIEGGEALMSVIGMLLAIPLTIIDTILCKLFGNKGSNIAWVILILGSLGYFIFF